MIDLISAGGSGIHRPVAGAKSKKGKSLAPGEEFKAKVSPARCPLLMCVTCHSLTYAACQLLVTYRLSFNVTCHFSCHGYVTC